MHRSNLRMAICLLASAILSAIYAQGGAAWPLGFLMLAPWLAALNAVRTWSGALACAWAMSVAYTAAVFPWLGAALGRYTGIGEAAGLALLLLGAPLFQPQFLALALVRHGGARRHGPLLRALAAGAAWVAAERLLPRLLGDTLGYGLYPASLLRQAADVGGSAGLTWLLLLSNEGVAAALARRADGWRAALKPLAAAAMAPLLLAAYGAAVLSGAPAPAGQPLRVGLIQANMADYENQRREKGAYAVVREVLDRHFAMSYDAVVRQRAQAVLWSETAYPTTFGQPKSEAGAQFDQEILAGVQAAGVPFLFGTYDRDGAGEYNAAALVQPGPGPNAGLLGFYRKTRLFPFTEYVPAWLDGPLLRRWLPWTGGWKPGNGARVLPLRLADGREVPVQPLICLDDVDTGLAIAGARLGAQAILTMSNDSWFSDYPQGARLHQAVAAFRSIETRLPQWRVTTNGYSAAIDPNGAILAGVPMGQPALVIADMPVRRPAPTLMVLWGDWVGLAACGLLLLLALGAALRPAMQAGGPRRGPATAMAFPAKVAVLPPAARLAAGALRTLARASLAGMGVLLLADEALRANLLAQMRWFAGLFLAPEAAAWCILRAYAAHAWVEGGRLVLARGAVRAELALADIAAVEPWRLPAPTAGAGLRLAQGRRWRHGLALDDPAGFAEALALAGGPARTRGRAAMDVYAQARAPRGGWRLGHPAVKFLLLPLALAAPAFHLHQHIAYGSALGEYYSFGLRAYLTAFALWWAAWAIGVAVSAALLRMGIEIVALLAALLRPAQAAGIRHGLERAGHAALYVGLPAWLVLRLVVA